MVLTTDWRRDDTKTVTRLAGVRVYIDAPSPAGTTAAEPEGSGASRRTVEKASRSADGGVVGTALPATGGTTLVPSRERL